MEKITLKALELAGFKNADSIAKIISYVPNPQVAVEMLLGVYTPSYVDVAKRFKLNRYRVNELAEIIDIDDLGDTLTYRVYTQKTKQVWYLTEEDKKNNIYIEDRPSKYYDYSHMPTTGYTVIQETTKTENFYDRWSITLDLDEAFEKLNQWDMYDVPKPAVEADLPF